MGKKVGMFFTMSSSYDREFADRLAEKIKASGGEFNGQLPVKRGRMSGDQLKTYARDILDNQIKEWK